MTTVFVHGVPETAQIWDGVRAALSRESVALSLPGFGTPRPEGFGATKDDYVHWVMERLEELDGPIDLVGHDWGAALTGRIATAHPHRLRSWAVDIANGFHPDYVWHDFAKIWQTPGDGEAFWETQLALDDDTNASIYESMGVPHDEALKLVRAVDQTMASCILDLYRSAVPNIYADWGAEAEGKTEAPGLIMQPTEDPFGDEAMSNASAERLGAKVVKLDGLGHWWMLQDPARGAAALEEFWNGL